MANSIFPSTGTSTVNVDEALSGDGTSLDPLTVLVDGVTVTVNGSNQLESVASSVPVGSITGLGSNVSTWLATPSSANLASAVTGETGSGALVFATSPTLVTPALGTPASGTLTNTTGFPTANLAGAGAGVLTFLATPSSANLASAVTGETGSGALVFGTSPTISTPVLLLGYVTKDTDYTIAATDYAIELVTNAQEFTLPAVAAGNLGKQYVLKNAQTANALTVTPAGSDTIDGAVELVFTDDTIVLESDGVSSWRLVSSLGPNLTPAEGAIPYSTTTAIALSDPTALAWDASLGKLRVGPTSSLVKVPWIGTDIAYTTVPSTPPQALDETWRVRFTTVQAGTSFTQGRIGMSVWAEDAATVVDKTITGAANNGSGLIRITAATHTFATGDRINIYGVTGTTEANGSWIITVITANTFDLVGSTFTNAYVSGGTATNRGTFYAARLLVNPRQNRSGMTGSIANADDVVGLAISNFGQKLATEAIYITATAIGGGAPTWYSGVTVDADCNYGFKLGAYTFTTGGIDIADATMTGPAINLGAGHNIKLDTATGTKIGTATTQKLGFYNSTPIVQPASTTDLRTALINLGLYATGGASPLNLNGGVLTTAQAVVTTGTITSSTPGLNLTQTWNSGGTTFYGILSDITNTASAAVSQLIELRTGGSARFNITPTGITSILGADGASTTAQLFNFSNNLTANTTVPTFIAYQSAGTQVTPLRTQDGQVILRMGASGYTAVDDSTTAAIVAASKVRWDYLALGDWTTSNNGSYMRAQTTASGSTTATTRFFIDETGATIGTAVVARGTTQPTNALNIFDGTAPVGTLTNGVTFYSASGEARVMDAAGNSTLLSPHNAAGEWIHDEVNFKGRKLRVDMERLVKAVDQLLGGGYVTES